MKTQYYITIADHLIDVWRQNPGGEDTLELTFSNDDSVEGVCESFALYFNTLQNNLSREQGRKATDG